MRKRVLWGHHLDEYRDMFDLDEQDLTSSFLEYGCGPSAVNVELQGTATKIISVDPLFSLNKTELTSTVGKLFDERVAYVKQDSEAFDFSRYGSQSALIQYRQTGMATFFKDYDAGLSDKRYLPLNDTGLPFDDFTFDIALCSHYLFAKHDAEAVARHMNVIRELARVAKDVRIFPLIDHMGEPTPIIGPLLLELQAENYGAEVREVSYRLQHTGHAMLRVWAQQCPVHP